MSRLFHRLSFRRRPRRTPAAQDSPGAPSAARHQHKNSLAGVWLRKSPISCPDISHCLRLAEPAGAELGKQAEAALALAADCLDDLFALIRLRALSQTLRQAVDERLGRITKLDVKRVVFDDFLRPQAAQPHPADGPAWHLHPAGCRLAARWRSPDSVDLLVDEQWSSKEVGLLRDALRTLRPSLTHVWLDAPVVELVIAGLSLHDLDRWYALQCFMQVANDPKVRLDPRRVLPAGGPGCAAPPTMAGSASEGRFWPNLEHLVIRTTERDSFHLARVLDYGVKSQCVIDRHRLTELQVQLLGCAKLSKCLNSNLYNFRCWAGTAGFDHRFSHQFARPEIPSL